MVRAARVAFAVSFVLLNIYLAWDTGLLRAISPALMDFVNAPIQWMNITVWTDLDLIRITPFAYIVTDFVVLALLITTLVSFAWLNRNTGLRGAVLRSGQVGALCLVSFGLQLGLLDCGEFTMHVTDFQVSFNVIPWFSNAHLLIASLSALAAITLVVNRATVRTQWERVTSSGPPHGTVLEERRDYARFAVLLFFGALFVAGGSLVGYYGGAWRLSYSNAGIGPQSLHYAITTYSGCLNHLRLISALSSNPSCALDSLRPEGYLFIGVGGISILAGLFTLRRRSAALTESAGRFWWLVAVLVPLLGAVIGYKMTKDKNKRRSGLTLVIVSAEMLFVLALIVSAVDLTSVDIAAACTLPGASPYM